MNLSHPGNLDIEYPPKNWHFIEFWGEGHAFAHKNGLRLLIDCEEKEDGNKWIHISISRKNWNPSHDDMCLVKNDFLGNRYAYAVYPPKENYVNIHSHCLHLWSRIDDKNGQVLPEFSSNLLKSIGIEKTI